MFRKLKRIVKTIFSTPPIGTWEKWLKFKGVDVRGKVRVYGRLNIVRWGEPSIIVEDGVTFDSDPMHNEAGILHPCTLAVTGRGRLYIGAETGMSGVLICCQDSITIGSHVGLGANVTIFDTDFHPVNPYERIVVNDDNTIRRKPVQIDDYVWVGANAMILKGVHIGRGAVIGAGSVVAKDVPPLTIFAGNPARYIKDVEISEEQKQSLFGCDENGIGQ